MRVWTFGESLDEVRGELDLTNETFIGDDEYVGFYNKAVQKAAAEIIKLGVEDEYFLDEAFLSLMSGTAAYALPSRIMANKIRAVIFNDGQEIYEVLRAKRKNKFQKIAVTNQFSANSRYSYYIRNQNVTTGYELVLFPPARETSSTIMKVHFIREPAYIALVSAGSLAASRATKIDLPTFMPYLQAEVKYRIAAKIPHPNLAVFEDDRDRERGLMIETLTQQVDDDNTEVEADLSHYGESS